MTPRASLPSSPVPRPRSLPRTALVWGGALGTALLLTGCHLAGTYDHTATSVYTVGGHISSVRVDGSGGRILVDASAATDRVKVTETVHYDGKRPATAHTVDKGVLDLSSKTCAHGGKCRVEYHLQVPAAMAARLLSHGGETTVHGAAGKLDVDSAGGRVTADGTAASGVTVRSHGGGVSLSFTDAPGRVDVDSAGGSAQVRLPSDGYAVHADSGGGSREVGVRVDPRSARTVTVDSHGGRIRVLPST